MYARVSCVSIVYSINDFSRKDISLQDPFHDMAANG